jgi:hypothetical protein
MIKRLLLVLAVCCLASVAKGNRVVNIGGTPPAPDTTPPTLTSATIASNGTTFTMTFSETVAFGAGGNGGFVPTLSAGAPTLSYSSGTGSATLIYTLSATVNSGVTGTLAYTQPTNGVQDDPAGNDLATFSGTAITNNSSQGGTAFTGDILWWKLNEGSGVSITPDVGQYGTTNAQWTASTQNGSGSALQFTYLWAEDASTNSDVNYSSATAITIAFWIKRGANSSTQLLFESSLDWNTNSPAFLAAFVSDKIEVNLSDAAGGIRKESTSATVGSGSWAHYAFVLDHSANSGAGDIKIYINGVDQATVVDTNTKVAATFANQMFTIGAGANGVLTISGDIDDVMICTGEKSASAIAATYAAGAH